jgi:acetyl-CoA C-acetyltransferase
VSPRVLTGGTSTRDQDAFAAESYARGIASRDAGNFDWEVTPIPVPSKAGGAPGLVTRDEELSRTPISSLAGQRPAFKKDPADPGTVTAGNASPLSDGAAAAVLMSAGRAAALGVQPLAEILGYGDAETAPERFTIAPSLSLPVALRRAGVAIEDVDLFEVNEAFSVVALANAKLLGLDLARVNVHGGAVSLGHPLGCSGARIVVTLVNALRMRGGGVGAAAVCNGGGGSSAIVLRVHPPSET